MRYRLYGHEVFTGDELVRSTKSEESTISLAEQQKSMSKRLTRSLSFASELMYHQARRNDKLLSIITSILLIKGKLELEAVQRTTHEKLVSYHPHIRSLIVERNSRVSWVETEVNVEKHVHFVAVKVKQPSTVCKHHAEQRFH